MKTIKNRTLKAWVKRKKASKTKVGEKNALHELLAHKESDGMLRIFGAFQKTVDKKRGSQQNQES